MFAFALERPEYAVAAKAVAEMYAHGGGIVVIDGHPGSGKTALAKYLSWKCGIALVEADLFIRPGGGWLSYRIDHIREIIAALRRMGQSVILDSAIAQQALADVGYIPNLAIRVSAIDLPDLDEPMKSQVLSYEANHQRVDLSLFLLPLPNEHAHGLRLTMREWTTVMQFVAGQPQIKEAWIFGSRATGIRTPKDPPKPPDIDLAIKPNWDWHDEDGYWHKRSHDFMNEHQADLDQWGIHLDWHGAGGRSDEWHVKGQLIWPPN